MTEAKREQGGEKDDAVVGDTAGTLRMNDVAAALQTMENGLESMNSTSSTNSSCQTSAPTPPQASSPVHGLLAVEMDTEEVMSSEASMSGSSTPTQAGDGGPKRRGVRFADECESELITRAFEITDWWDDMVVGIDRCPSCGHVATSAAAAADSIANGTGGWNRGESTDLSICERCGASYRTLPPGELSQFIEELSEGVEATLLESTFIGKKRTRVLLYTEDNGQSICWLETGSKHACEPYCVPCNTLEEVKDCTGLTRRKRRVGSTGSSSRGPGRLPADDATAKGGVFSISSATAFKGFKGSQLEAEAASSVDGYRDVKTIGSATASTPAGEDSGEANAGVSPGGYKLGGVRGDDSSGGGRDIRIKLRWRPKPTFPLKKVTIVDVRCSSPVVFTRGMVQLLEHNTDLLT